MCFLRHNELLFIHSIAKNYNSIGIVKKYPNFFAQIFRDFGMYSNIPLDLPFYYLEELNC